MYTLIALILSGVFMWRVSRQASRANDADRRIYDDLRHSDESRWLMILHIRQDLALIAFLLGTILTAILVMMGIIADGLGDHLREFLGWPIGLGLSNPG